MNVVEVGGRPRETLGDTLVLEPTYVTTYEESSVAGPHFARMPGSQGADVVLIARGPGVRERTVQPPGRWPISLGQVVVVATVIASWAYVKYYHW